MKAEINWTGHGLQYTGQDERGANILIDGKSTIGPSPMNLLLFGVASCSASDIIDILGKMREPLPELKIAVDAVRGEGDYPRIWEKIHLIYYFSGETNRKKAEKAVKLSMDKYCSVSAMLAKASEISYEIVWKD